MVAQSSDTYSEVEAFKKELIQKHRQVDSALGRTYEAAGTEHIVRVKDWVQDLEKEFGIKVKVIADYQSLEGVAESFVLPCYPFALTGLTTGDQIFLIANVIATHQQAMDAYQQEVIGRFGVKLLLGSQLNVVAQQIFDSMGVDKLDYLQEQLGFKFDLSTQEGRQSAALEHLARLAGIGRKPSFEQARVSWYRSVARRFYPKLSWTHDDLCALIQRARRKLS